MMPQNQMNNLHFYLIFIQQNLVTDNELLNKVFKKIKVNNTDL